MRAREKFTAASDELIKYANGQRGLVAIAVGNVSTSADSSRISMVMVKEEIDRLASIRDELVEYADGHSESVTLVFDRLKNVTTYSKANTLKIKEKIDRLKQETVQAT